MLELLRNKLPSNSNSSSVSMRSSNTRTRSKSHGTANPLKTHPYLLCEEEMSPTDSAPDKLGTTFLPLGISDSSSDEMSWTSAGSSKISAQQSGPWVGRLTNSHPTQTVATANPFADTIQCCGLVSSVTRSTPAAIKFDNSKTRLRSPTFTASSISAWHSSTHADTSPGMSVLGLAGTVRPLPTARRFAAGGS